MGGSSENAYNWKEVKLAPYIESRHSSVLDVSDGAMNAAMAISPYSGYAQPSVDTAFLGIGYLLSSFPSMYVAFGQHMSGIDIDSLFSNTFSGKLHGAVCGDLTETEITIEDDANNAIIKATLEARNSNSTHSSTFLIAKSIIEKNRVNRLSAFRAENQFLLIPGAVGYWNKTLAWDKSLVTRYAESLLRYYLAKTTTDEKAYTKITENTLWPLTVLDYHRTVLNIMRGVRTSRTGNARERSNLSKALVVASYTAQGVYIGSVAPGIGNLVGGVIGFAVGLGAVLLE